MKFNLVKTNIVNVKADAIVLPANENLKEGSGASTAIYKAAGRKKLTQACNKIGHCKVGSAVATPAFNLKAQYIIHAVVPKWIDGDHNEYDLLSSTYLSALQLADIMECTSIAFPLLASGHNGYDMELAFQIAKESIESFTGSSLKKISLVLFGDHITSIVRGYGYEVFEISEDLQKQDHKETIDKLIGEGKEIALKFVEDQIKKGLDYLNDEQNREAVLAAGIDIAKKVFKATKKSK